MDWKFENDRPIYTQLVERIEQAVLAGEYPPGSRLPGVRELAGIAGVNPNTMQRALAELEGRGLLYSQRTSGRFVTEDEQRIALLRESLAVNKAKEFVASMNALGCSPDEVTKYVNKAREEL